jgi:hypothetical protein
MAGALKTLFGALSASSFLTGVSLVYGEEEIGEQSIPLPMVAIVPRGGPFVDDPGYINALDPTVERVWGISESVDLYLWAFSTATGATAIDHADATESLRQLVLSALQDQRVQFDSQGNQASGLWFKAVSERWEAMQGGFDRYGRALVLTVTVEISVPMATPPNATVTSETISYTVVNKAS